MNARCSPIYLSPREHIRVAFPIEAIPRRESDNKKRGKGARRAIRAAPRESASLLLSIARVRPIAITVDTSNTPAAAPRSSRGRVISYYTHGTAMSTLPLGALT